MRSLTISGVPGIIHVNGVEQAMRILQGVDSVVDGGYIATIGKEEPGVVPRLSSPDGAEVQGRGLGVRVPTVREVCDGA